MKKNELTYMIREIIAEEIRKELPIAIAEVFQSFMGQKPVIKEEIATSHIKPEPVEEEINLKQSLREMFAGTKVMSNPQAQPVARKFTKDPVLNEILNQTRPFTSQERTGATMGMAAMLASQGGFSVPGVMSSPMMESTAAGEDPTFLRNVPNITSLAPTVSQAQLLNDNHIPLADLPEGVSVMDVKQHAPAAVASALTRNYSQMMKLIDKKRGKV